MSFLFLWQWACSSTVVPMEGFVKCILPFIAACLKSAVITTVTCILGGYGFAVALCGLIPAFDGPYVANYVFFIVAGITMILGIIFQCIFCKPDPEKKARADQYRADEKARKAQQQQGGTGVRFIAP